MDLSKITSKVNSKISLTKEIEISGIKFVVGVPSFDQQSILDSLSSAMENAPEDGQAEEYARRALAYSLVSVDGELLGSDTKDLLEEVRKWPPTLISSLVAAAFNLRLEVAAKVTNETKFEWFDIEKFSLQMTEKKAKELADRDAAAKAAEENISVGAGPEHKNESSSFQQN